MSEKYYVVSESELERLKRAAANEALTDSMRWDTADDELYEAEAACRGSPILLRLGGLCRGYKEGGLTHHPLGVRDGLKYLCRMPIGIVSRAWCPVLGEKPLVFIRKNNYQRFPGL